MATEPECLNQTQGHDCGDLYDCCDCGYGECGCAYCFACNACEVCHPPLDEETLKERCS